jgi:DSF synthase
MKASIDHVTRLFADSSAVEPPVRYTVMASRMPGIFNLGGDLRHFAELIRNKDRATIRQYAHACIDVQHPRAVNMNLPIVSISLVQGDALGGGFEAALADNVIIAEKSAKFGLPECLFNLFPGMGALSFLTRKIGAPLAEKMVFSGQIYTASELHEMGVVEVVCEDGMGEQAVYDFVEKADRSFASRRSVYASRQIINPVSRDELIRITDMWVESALTLTPMDLRKMERLASAQDRRWATVNRTAAE